MSHDEYSSADISAVYDGRLAAVRAFAHTDDAHAGASHADAAEADGSGVADAGAAQRRARSKPVGAPSDLPRYQVIAFDLQQEIVAGRYRIGELLPTEADLVERFDVSRFTVREALRQLERLGLVRRRRGSGTCVQSRAPLEQFTQRLQSLHDLVQYPPSALTIETANKIRLTRAEAELLGAAHGETWMRADGMRRAIGTGAHLCTATLWLRPEFASLIRPELTVEGSMHQRLESLFGVRIERVDVKVDCRMPSNAESRRHGMVMPVPMMRLVRRFTDGRNRTLQVSRDTLPADRFAYQASFQRDVGPS